jgi:hypothetical protein
LRFSQLVAKRFEFFQRIGHLSIRVGRLTPLLLSRAVRLLSRIGLALGLIICQASSPGSCVLARA